MGELALEVRVAPELPHDLGPEERGEILGHIVVRDVRQDTDGERATDCGGRLGESAGARRGEPVDPRQQEVLQRRGEELG